MKIEQTDRIKLIFPGKPAIITTLDWWIWVAHSNGLSLKQISQELSLPIRQICKTIVRTRDKYFDGLNPYDPVTRN